MSLRALGLVWFNGGFGVTLSRFEVLVWSSSSRSIGFKGLVVYGMLGCVQRWGVLGCMVAG